MQNIKIKALLLAAGFGKRLRPLTLNKPKCLMEINNRPILGYWLDKLEEINVEKILINTHYLSEQVNHFLEKDYKNNRKIKTSFEKVLLGTAGTLIKNYKFFSNSTGLIIHADNFTHMGLIDFLNSHYNRPKNCLITMLTFNTNTPESCGIVELDSKGIVKDFHEKVSNPPGNKANGAVYAFDKEFIEWLIDNHSEARDLSKDIIPLLLGRIFTHHTDMNYIDIGTIKSLNAARSINKK